MKKIKNKRINNICRCAVCNRNAANNGIKSPFGTVVCWECANAIHQMWNPAIKSNFADTTFIQQAPSSDEPEYNPLIPLFSKLS